MKYISWQGSKWYDMLRIIFNITILITIFNQFSSDTYNPHLINVFEEDEDIMFINLVKFLLFLFYGFHEIT